MDYFLVKTLNYDKMIKVRNIKMIGVGDWDELVLNTYKNHIIFNNKKDVKHEVFFI